MRQWMSVAAMLLGLIPSASSPGQVLQLGLDNVGWESNNQTMLTTDSGPLLYRTVSESDLVSVKAKISAQTAGFWSQSGILVRAPNPIDGAGAQEDWVAAWSFRPNVNGPYTLQSNMSTIGVEAEINNDVTTTSDLTYLRLDNLGGGTFQAYRGSGPENAIVWTPAMDAMMAPASQTNANLSGIPLQVGVAGGALGALAGSSALFDWVEIETTSQTFRDDFNYVRDFSTDGIPPAGIWSGIENAAAGGINTQTGDLGGCVVCSWNTDGSGDFHTVGNWLGDVGQAILIPPSRNVTTVVFGAASVTGPVTVYTNTNATVKQIDFDNATNPYVLGGAGSVTLDADAGNALINVLNGSHEIQADLILADNVTATAAAGTTLNVNAAIVLNGKTFTTAGAGTINLNNGTIVVGGSGGGSVSNDGNLSGLGSVAGDFSQSGGGSLAVEVGGSSIEILGAAELDGTLSVSLANGFVPTVGESYAVLTAASVTDQGLSLSGDAAGMFQLAVDGSSISLLAVAIPEPTSCFLLLIGTAAIALARRRSGGARWPVNVNSIRTCLSVAVAMILLGGVAAQGDTLTFGPADQPVTYRDDFNSFFDYEAANGGVPAGTLTNSLGGTNSWSAVHNPQNGGDRVTFPDFPATLQANGSFMGVSKPGVLVIEDQGIHPNTDGATLGVGWEGNANNAPFLFANVDAGDNFQATVKIDAQTAGFWSYSGLIARRAGPPVGLGPGDTLDENEAFITMGSFRTTTEDDPETTDVDETFNANMLVQNIVPGAGETELNVFAGNGLPLWVRMTKEASRFTASSSLDGITYTDHGSMINPELNNAGQLLEVGMSHMMFPTTVVPGAAAEFDFFEITVLKQQRFLDARWVPTAAGFGSGNWNNGENWDSETAPGQVPNVNSVNVELSDGNAAFGPATVYNNSDSVVRSLTFNSANKYAISGTGSIMLEPDALSLDDTDATFINVVSGQHEIQVDMALSSAAANDNRVNALPGTRLDFDSPFNVNGKQLIVQGGGKVNFNNNIDTGTSGTVIVNNGNVGGGGRVNGNLRNGDNLNTGGVVSPGQGVGTLTVDGTFTQHSTGKLEIELGGTTAGTFDRLNVLSVATLDGLLDVKLASGFTLTNGNIGQTWDVITSPTIINSQVIELDPSDSPYFSLTCVNCGVAATPDVLRLTLLEPPPMGVIGDYNDDDVVDAADYTIWRDALGTATVLQNRDPANTGNVSNDDYNSWKAHFGQTPGSGSGLESVSGTVPEPNSLVLLFGTIILVHCGGRFRPCLGRS